MDLQLVPQAGPQFDLLVGTPQQYYEVDAWYVDDDDDYDPDDPADSPDPDDTEDIDGDWNRLGVGYVVGLGLETGGTGNQPGRAALDIRYHGQILGFGPDDVDDESQSIMRNFSISLAIITPIN